MTCLRTRILGLLGGEFGSGHGGQWAPVTWRWHQTINPSSLSTPLIPAMHALLRRQGKWVTKTKVMPAFSAFAA